jgi:hypothetical protein
LVHFAVSNEEVWMTTRLAGPNTYFLPFNAGDGHGGKGNAPSPAGSATSYLWEKVFDRDNWLMILGKWCAPASVESGCWNLGHGDRCCALEFYGCQPAEGGVPALAVVEDLEVLEDRVRELQAGAPATSI